MRRRTQSTLCLLVVMFATPSLGGCGHSKPTAPQLLEELRNRHRDEPSVEHRFKMTYEDVAAGRTKTTTGALISNGRALTLHFDGLGERPGSKTIVQGTRIAVFEDAQSEDHFHQDLWEDGSTAFLAWLLISEQPSAQRFDVLLNPERPSGVRELELKTRPDDQDHRPRRILVIFDAASWRLLQVEFSDPYGNKTTIVLN